LSQFSHAGAVDDCIDSIGNGSLKGCTVNAAHDSAKRCDQDPHVCAFNEICMFGFCRDKRLLASNEGGYSQNLIWAARGSAPDELIFTALPNEMKGKIQMARIDCTTIGKTTICHEEKENQ
jgi:hypothetical protein